MDKTNEIPPEKNSGHRIRSFQETQFKQQQERNREKSDTKDFIAENDDNEKSIAWINSNREKLRGYQKTFLQALDDVTVIPKKESSKMQDYLSNQIKIVWNLSQQYSKNYQENEKSICKMHHITISENYQKYKELAANNSQSHSSEALNTLNTCQQSVLELVQFTLKNVKIDDLTFVHFLDQMENPHVAIEQNDAVRRKTHREELKDYQLKFKDYQRDLQGYQDNLDYYHQKIVQSTSSSITDINHFIKKIDEYRKNIGEIGEKMVAKTIPQDLLKSIDDQKLSEQFKKAADEAEKAVDNYRITRAIYTTDRNRINALNVATCGLQYQESTLKLAEVINSGLLWLEDHST